MSQHNIAHSQEEESASSPEALVHDAGFIFWGTIRELGATTMAAVPVGKATAVVRVNSFLRGPKVLQPYVGKDITVQVRNPHELGVGQDVVFFAKSWVYGPSIALREIGHWDIKENLTRLRQKVVEVEQQLADRELGRHLADAALVIAGRVAQVAEVALQESEPKREHDPQWTEAAIVAEHVLERGGAGGREGKSEVVVFAGSRHVAWQRAPKLHVGQTGVWILHKVKIKEQDREVYAVLDPLDSWPSEEIGRIKALMQADVRKPPATRS